MRSEPLYDSANVPYHGSRDAIESVLLKLGISPGDRMDEFDQDPEYTACRQEELGKYLNLYRIGTLTTDERAVLACFMLESVNDFCCQGVEHPLTREILQMLLVNDEHSAELAYWMDTSDPDEDNWWPVTKSLLALQR